MVHESSSIAFHVYALRILPRHKPVISAKKFVDLATVVRNRALIVTLALPNQTFERTSQSIANTVQGGARLR
jgi:hypothetical protein